MDLNTRLRMLACMAFVGWIVWATLYGALLVVNMVTAR